MRKNFSLICALITLLFFTASCRSTVNKKLPEEIVEDNFVEDCDSEVNEINPSEFLNHLADLFKLQGLLLNDFIVAKLNHQSLEMMETGKVNLFMNTSEIGNLFTNIYGSRVALRIGELLSEQMKLFLAYLDALQSKNDPLAKNLLQQSYYQGHLFIEFLNLMNPFFAFTSEKYMMDEHITLVSNQAIAYLKEDIEQAEELKSWTVDQLEELAVHIAKAIETQIVDPFQWCEYEY